MATQMPCLFFFYTMAYTFSPDAAMLIAQFEGLRARPYLDTGGVPTIGYGSTTYIDGKKVTMNDASINKEVACEMLLYHLNKLELVDLNDCMRRKDLNQHQIDAIGCLMYNIGDAGFCGSGLHALIEANASIELIKEHWLAWDKVNGQASPGLLNRRTLEFNFYNKK